METLFTGQNHIHLSECPSVNTHAMELLKAIKLPEGTLISTDRQTSGRGQRGNMWESQDGKNLTVCIVYHPTFLSAENIFLLSMTVSLGIHDLLSCLLGSEYDISIKWPNDILVGKKKICGILIENLFRDGRLGSSVVGIGLNVNQSVFSDVITNVTSLNLLASRDFNLAELRAILCSKIERRFLQLRSGAQTDIKRDYMRRLYLRNSSHQYKIADGNNVTGKIVDVTIDGQMIIQSESGDLLKFRTKEILF